MAADDALLLRFTILNNEVLKDICLLERPSVVLLLNSWLLPCQRVETDDTNELVSWQPFVFPPETRESRCCVSFGQVRRV